MTFEAEKTLRLLQSKGNRETQYLHTLNYSFICFEFLISPKEAPVFHALFEDIVIIIEHQIDRLSDELVS